MKKIFMIAALICLTTFSVGSAGAALTLNFSSVGGASIAFDGTTKSFSFPNTGTYDFEIDSSDPLGSSAVGYFGSIDGTFTIGAITGTTTQEASVTGSGTFTIFDSDGEALEGTITWAQIFSYKKSGGIDPDYDAYGNASANLTAVSYEGDDNDLKQFLAGGGVNATYQFAGTGFKSLTYLTTSGNAIATTYSGSLSAIPIPGALVLLGAGLVRLAAYSRRKRTLA
jgi:hypothetical protein